MMSYRETVSRVSGDAQCHSLKLTALGARFGFLLVAMLTCLLTLALFVFSGKAQAATNSAAASALSQIQTQTYYKPGGSCPSGTNVGWLTNGSWNCENECYAFAKGVANKLYGSHDFISGVMTYGYKATSTGSYNTVGTLVDTPSASPSQSSVKTLLDKAYPGDVIQFKGGSDSWGYPQHTAIVQEVTSSGVKVYQHLNSSHVVVSSFSWDYFYNTYLDFDCYTSYDKGITLYHYKSYESKFPSHTHSYSTTYSYKSYNIHTVTKKCSCGSSSSSTERCAFTGEDGIGQFRKCSKCGKVAQPYGSNVATSIPYGDYYIFPASSDAYAVSVESGNTGFGANVRLETYTGGANQVFRIQSNEDNTYALGSYYTSPGQIMCTYWSHEDGGNVSLNYWIQTHMDTTWYAERTPDGYYSFRNKYSNKYLEVAGGTMANGQNVRQYEGNGGAAQKFRLVKVCEGSETSLVRIAGEYAKDTSALISAEAFADGGCDAVVVARDDDFRDAMSAAGLAGTLGCPILLTSRTGLSSVAADEIARLGAERAYVVGGTAALSDSVDSSLEAMGVDVERVWGEQSYDTSVACAEAMIAASGGEGLSSSAVVAYGQNFQDALSMSSFAYAHRVPILLQTFGGDSSERGLTDEAVSLVNASFPGTLYVAGGEGAVSSASLSGLSAFASGDFVRIGGYDGYETSALIAEHMVEAGLLDAGTVAVCCGAVEANGLDALSGSALAGLAGGVVLLANGQAAYGSEHLDDMLGFLSGHAGEVSSAYVLGGTYVMPSPVYDVVADVWGLPHEAA